MILSRNLKTKGVTMTYYVIIVSPDGLNITAEFTDVNEARKLAKSLEEAGVEIITSNWRSVS